MRITARFLGKFVGVTTLLLVGMIIAILGMISGAYIGGMIGVSITNYLLDHPQEPPQFVPYVFPDNYTGNCTECKNGENWTSVNWTCSYNRSYAAGGGGGSLNGSTLPEFNLAACDEDAKHLGQNCTCLKCGYWMGYETKGFFNLSGVYYSDGTPTGRTMKQMSDYEEMQSNLRYGQFMNEHGIYWNGNKWQY